jgi:hypothetical protein
LGISDPHSGFVLGLTNPETTLPDGHGVEKPIPELNESQKFVWDVYSNGLSETEKLAAGDPIHVFVMGDVTHGNKHISQQVSTRLSDQPIISSWALSPAMRLKNVKSSRIFLGTASHSFGEGSSEILVTALLRERFPKINFRALYHGLESIDGFRIDAAHHGPHPGVRNWTKGNVARLALQSSMMSELDGGNVPPDMYIRGHYHDFIRVWHGLNRMGSWYQSWMVIMPPLCLPGDWTIQATQSIPRVTAGIVSYEIVNGKLLDIYPFTETVDLRTHEEL